MPEIPENLRFSEDHLWAAAANGSIVQVGVTDYAQQSLGDVIDVRPPDVGRTVAAGDPCGEVESTKSVNDLIAPITGVVERSNAELSDSPELINSDPYGDGWILEFRVNPATLDEQLAGLMDAGAYRNLAGD
ncbi:MAG TPA: glycine cleavage system protein GcvH [Solirubrobacteraceae bacterium]|jgi:glycine cleavage system H protein|nr:glycine cleavage system protein GcvH [Solirubrobacteraceae bacterium]